MKKISAQAAGFETPVIDAKASVKAFLTKLSREQQSSLIWGVVKRLSAGDSNLVRIAEQRNIGEYLTCALPSSLQLYEDPLDLLMARVPREIFSKFPFPASPFNTREKAKIRFWQAEELCQRTNRRLKAGPTSLEPLIHRARAIVADILGEFNIAMVLDNARFGPGATLGTDGRKTTAYYKLGMRIPTVSAMAFPYAEALLNLDRKWLAYLSGIHPTDVGGRFNLVSDEFAPELEIRNYNKVTFVPKNAKTDRSIAIEPYFNIYFQLGVGGVMRRRLKKHGCDLDDQQRNQNAAWQGSIAGHTATIDFSMASDTISRETVRLLLPPVWYEHLDRLRSDSFVLDGKEHRYEKFSSMGNGYTFELESLIFLALARAVVQPRNWGLIQVYGDDVILPVDDVLPYIQLCEELGFKVNEEKSFWNGKFRESCGADYLQGWDVRGPYCKKLGCIKDVFVLYNQLHRFRTNVANYSNPQFDTNLARAMDFILEFIPDCLKPFSGPAGESLDSHLFVDGDLSKLRHARWNKSWQCWQHPAFVFSPRRYKGAGHSYGLFSHWSISQVSGSDVWEGRNTGSAITRRETGTHVVRYK